MSTLAWMILAFPLLGSIAIGLCFKLLKGRDAGIVGTFAIAAAFVCSILVTIKMQSHAPADRHTVTVLWNYAVTAGVDAKVSILIDPLSMFMALVVTGVSMLIHLYSIAYLSSDQGYNRFFGYLNFFVFSMLLLVLAANFVLLIVGWAFVGAASYMLISFWYRRTTATRAGLKAFVINVVGDIGLVLGTFFIFKDTGSVDFGTVFQSAAHSGDITAGCLLLLVGAFAKSAQVPLHTWLPDAMEGPTPVSALIHAATMVTAGVYLIARMYPLFQISPAAQDVGAAIGALTLLIAGTIALVQVDLKRVIAYSTMSQIGYMIMAVSAGAYVAGLFHLMTHAFFKALLFMAAGSIIGAMAGEQSLDKMGGFRKALPFTYLCFIIGGLALAGVPPLSGFFSKDEILADLGSMGGWHWILYVVGYIGALLTAIYTFRMIFRAFWGDPVPEALELEQGHLHHADQPTNPANGEVEDNEVGFPGPLHWIAEQSLPMRLAMGTLALLAVIGGWIQIPNVDDVLTKFLAPTFAGATSQPDPSNSLTYIGWALGTVIALGGIFIAYVVWVRKPGTSAAWQRRLSGVYTVLWHKWYFDEAIDLLVVRPVAWCGRVGQQTVERVLINGFLVGGASGLARAGGAAVRALQSGFLRAYAAVLLLGVAALTLYLLLQS